MPEAPTWLSVEAKDFLGGCFKRLEAHARDQVLQLASERKAAAGPAPALGSDFLVSIIDSRP